MTDTKDRYTYPGTIENRAGEQIVFLRRVPGSRGDRLELENVVKPGAGPPMHVHHFQEEALTVRQGRIGYQRPEGPAQYAGPGDTVTFKAGEAHKFWNAGDDDLCCTGYVEPAGSDGGLASTAASTTRRSRFAADPVRGRGCHRQWAPTGPWASLI